MVILWFVKVPPGLSGGTVGPGMLSPHQTMLVQGLGQSGPFAQGGPGGMLQGPLAYLEKTTSNIGKCLNYCTLVL